MKLQSCIVSGMLLASLFVAGTASATVAGSTFNTDFSNFTLGGAFNGPVTGPNAGNPGAASAGNLLGGVSLIGAFGPQALSDFVLAGQPGLEAGEEFDFSIDAAGVEFLGVTAGAAVTDGVGGGVAGAGGAGAFTQVQAPLYLSGNTALIIGTGDTITIDFDVDVLAASFTLLNAAADGATLDFQLDGDDIIGNVGGSPFSAENVFVSVTDEGIIENIQLANLSASNLISIDNFSFTTAPVPLPAAAWLFLSAFGSFFAFARKKKNVAVV